MYTEEEKQFIALNDKFRVELGEVERQIEILEDRRSKLIDMIDGNAEIEEDSVKDRVTNPDNLDMDYALVNFLKANPGSFRANIVEGLSGYSEDDIKRSLSRVRRRGLAISEGRSRAAQWYVTEEA